MLSVEGGNFMLGYAASGASNVGLLCAVHGIIMPQPLMICNTQFHFFRERPEKTRTTVDKIRATLLARLESFVLPQHERFWPPHGKTRSYPAAG